MTHGTVIEVATWRGTGRPDSRTNRMMLGMSNTEIEAQIQEEEERQEIASTSGWRGRLQMAQGIAVAVFAKAKSLALGLFAKVRKDKSSDTSAEKTSTFKSLPFVGKSESASTPDDDVQAWLDKITAKSLQKKKTTTSTAKSTSVARKSSSKKASQPKK
jgi:hypothetical protein